MENNLRLRGIRNQLSLPIFLSPRQRTMDRRNNVSVQQNGSARRQIQQLDPLLLGRSNRYNYEEPLPSTLSLYLALSPALKRQPRRHLFGLSDPI